MTEEEAVSQGEGMKYRKRPVVIEARKHEPVTPEETALAARREQVRKMIGVQSYGFRPPTRGEFARRKG